MNHTHKKGLECGFESMEYQDEMRKVLNQCMGINKDGENDVHNSTAVSNSTVAPKKYDNETVEELLPNNATNITANSSLPLENLEEFMSESLVDNANETETKVCVVQCIFQNMGMSDPEGVPRYDKVSEVMIKPSFSRELADFYQESIDDCFQMVSVANMDPCEFSGRLMTCLADKGRQNCADFPVGNLPFPH